MVYMSRLMSFLLMILFKVSLVCAQIIIMAEEGDTVILPCEMKPPGNSTLIWKCCGSKTFLKFKQGGKLECKDKRVDIFPVGYTTGNLSIKISNVHVNDSGSYECHLQPDRLQKNMELKVSEKKIKESDENSKVQLGGSAVVLQLSAYLLMLAMGFLFM